MCAHQFFVESALSLSLQIAQDFEKKILLYATTNANFFYFSVLGEYHHRSGGIKQRDGINQKGICSKADLTHTSSYPGRLPKKFRREIT